MTVDGFVTYDEAYMFVLLVVSCSMCNCLIISDTVSLDV